MMLTCDLYYRPVARRSSAESWRRESDYQEVGKDWPNGAEVARTRSMLMLVFQPAKTFKHKKIHSYVVSC